LFIRVFKIVLRTERGFDSFHFERHFLGKLQNAARVGIIPSFDIAREGDDKSPTARDHFMKSVGKIVRYQLAGGVALIEARRVGDRFGALALHVVEHLMDVLHIDAFVVKALPKVGKFFAFGRRQFGLVCHLVILLLASRERLPK
jgi:hypothetical protein